MSKENSLRHFLNIWLSECDNELDGSEDPESVVGPAALLLHMGVTGVVIARSARRREGAEACQQPYNQIIDALHSFYVPTQTITTIRLTLKRNMRTVKLVVIGNTGVGKTSLRGQVRKREGFLAHSEFC